MFFLKTMFIIMRVNADIRGDDWFFLRIFCRYHRTINYRHRSSNFSRKSFSLIVFIQYIRYQYEKEYTLPPSYIKFFIIQYK